MKNKIRILYALILLLSILLGSCKKLIEIDTPIGSIVTETAFSSDINAEATVRGLYGNMLNGNLKFINGGITVYTGMSADEFIPLSAAGAPYQNNVLTVSNSTVTNLWSNAYTYVYHANACIDGLTNATGLSLGIKNRLLGEVKFIRAFNYFYLLNLFGDVPLITSVDWRVTSLQSRASKPEVYALIITDLIDAKTLLPVEYVFGEKTRVNKWAATALLARVYLYMEDWAKAEAHASDLITNGGFSLTTNLSDVFMKNSSEAILQFQPSASISPSFNGTVEGVTFIPRNSNTVPSYYFTDQLKTTFEVGDLRFTNWSATIIRSGVTYRYPYKYKVRGVSGNTTVTEYYMLLRLAEQYLIRAEARAHQDNIGGARVDLLEIRRRAGLADATLTANDKATLLAAIEHERRIELFAEWGHRWFDLKRTKGINDPTKTRADEVLGPLKSPNWQSTDMLYPIPLSEIQRNPNLIQNPGYQ